MEGKMFKPLAYTIMIALLVSLLLSLTLSPALCSLALTMPRRKTRGCAQAKRWCSPALTWALAHRRVVLISAVTMLGLSLHALPFLGEFIPILNEAAITPQTIRLPSISLEKSIEIELEMQRAVMEFQSGWWSPRSVVRNWATIRRSLMPAIRSFRLSRWTNGRRPRPSRSWTMRYADALLEQASCSVSPSSSGWMNCCLCTVGSDGQDHRRRPRTTSEDGRTGSGHHGWNQRRQRRTRRAIVRTGLPLYRHRPGKIARYGINVAHIREIISTVIGAEAATRVYEGQKRFRLILRYPKKYRDSVETISNILLRASTGALIPLGELAKVELREGPVDQQEGFGAESMSASIPWDAISKVSSEKPRPKLPNMCNCRQATV